MSLQIRLDPTAPGAVVQRQVDAYNAMNGRDFAACYAPDAVVASHPGGEVIAAGRAAIRRYWEELFERFTVHCTVTNRIVFGDFVIDAEEVRRLPPLEVVRAVAIYEVKDGLIARVWFLEDRSISQTGTPD